MGKILSICIPTYNMEKYLDENIQEIVKIVEANNLKEKIEICISDNASVDNTEVIIQKYIAQDVCTIVYHKNNENLGADRNFLKAVDIASGDYIWLLGADDILLESAFLDIIFNINKNSYDILLGDRLNMNLLGVEKQIQYWAKEKMLVTESNYCDFLSDTYRLGAVFSYISSIIFSKKQWDSEIEILDMEKFIGTNYIHSVILISMIKHGSEMEYLHYPLVKNRVGNDSFLGKGYFNRIKIDFQYLSIFEYIFTKSSCEYRNMKLLLDRERTLLHFLKTKYLVAHSEVMKKEFFNFLKKNNIKNKFLIKIFPNFLIFFLLFIYDLRSK